MAIATIDQLIAASKQTVGFSKTGARTTIAAQPFSMWEVAGNPGGGTLAGTSTTTGVVPTDATAGSPIINFSTGTGYIAGVKFNNSVACMIAIYDLLWKGGAYAFNASTTGQTPTSFLSRIPGGTAADTAGCTEIWVEQVTAATGNQAVNVTYNDETGASGSTGAVGIGGAPTVGRMWQLPLASGDNGVSGVTGVAGTVATVGTFNVLVMRPLWRGRVSVANDGGVHGFDATGMPVIFPDTCLFMMIQSDTTSAGAPYISLDIANG